MSPRRWLASGFRAFLRWAWLDRSDSLAEVKRPRNTHKPKAPARLGLDRLEVREVPLDLFGLFSGGFSLGGLRLIDPVEGQGLRTIHG